MSFSKMSRYANAPLRSVPGPDGEEVTIVEAVPREEALTLGWHQYQPGQRLDHLGHAYTGGAQTWWRVPDHMNAMWPDAIVEEDEIAIPDTGGAR